MGSAAARSLVLAARWAAQLDQAEAAVQRCRDLAAAWREGGSAVAAAELEDAIDGALALRPSGILPPGHLPGSPALDTSRAARFRRAGILPGLADSKGLGPLSGRHHSPGPPGTRVNPGDTWCP